MSGGRIRLRLLTPEGPVAEREAEYVVMRTDRGDLGVLPGHEPCVSVLDYGVLQVFRDGRCQEVFALMGGFALVEEDGVDVLTTAAARPEELDEVLRRMERERADSRRSERVADAELQRMEMALRRSLVQMDVSAYAVLRGGEREDGGDEKG